MPSPLALALADAVVVVHAAFVLFVVLGGLLVIRRPRMAWFHLPAAAWGAVVELLGLTCPLTPLENWLRAQGGGSTYTASFVEQYVVPLLYPASLSREHQWLLGTLVIVVNAVIYGEAARRARALSGRPPR